eukprot:TRINITY_DN4830_c0_g1_i1.p1 TRINITY_DN4830_c0_g1~~TRINITY_DN4830_c0_g1_i1.p1  ORF type:complete len:196 (+),score=14.64 TRINITY_DN4830_c0_g1_i1:151-738(+)
MARVGSSDFCHSYQGPNQRQQYWREVVNRSYWDHPFHALAEKVPKPSYKEIASHQQETLATPWRHLRNSFHVGKDDMGAAYLDRRQEPLGLSAQESAGHRSHSVTGSRIPIGTDPLATVKLHTTLRTSASSGALPMRAKMATMRGEIDLGRSDRAPSCRAPTYAHEIPGWGASDHANVRSQKRTRAPSYTRILNV